MSTSSTPHIVLSIWDFVTVAIKDASADLKVQNFVQQTVYAAALLDNLDSV